MGTRMGLAAVVAAAGLALAACGEGDDAGVTPAPSAAPSTVDVESGPSEAPTTSAEGGADREGTPADGGGALAGADRRPKTSSVREGHPVLLGVRAGSHPGYTRYVFDFTNHDPEGHSPLGTARPAWDVRYVPPSEAVQDGSGDPPPVGGTVYLRIRFEGAAAHYEDGSPSIRYGLDAHAPLGFGGDFEGRVTWFLGLEQERPFRVSFVGNDRVVVDVADG